MNQEIEGEGGPVEWKIKALDAFAGIPIGEITTMKIQMQLLVGYHLAVKIKDWLLMVKGRQK